MRKIMQAFMLFNYWSIWPLIMVKHGAIKCDFQDCDKVYSSQCNLNRHIKLHHLKQAFVCPLCQKQLSSKQSKDEHMFSHAKESPYKCPFVGCQKRFRQASQLSFHKKLHSLGAIGDADEGSSRSPATEEKPTVDIPFYYLPIPEALQSKKP